MPYKYDLYFDKTNKVWFQYKRNTATNRREKIILGKGKSKTNDRDSYILALEKWKELTFVPDTPHRRKLVLDPNRTKMETKDKIQGMIDRFLLDKRRLVKSRDITAGTYQNICVVMGQYENWLGPKRLLPNSAADLMNSMRFKGWHTHLKGRVAKEELTQSSAHNRWIYVKQFYHYCWLNESLKELPRAYADKSLNFHERGKGGRRVSSGLTKKVSTEDLSTILDFCMNPEGYLRREQVGFNVGAWLIVSLNCGWTIKEIANLQRKHLVSYDGTDDFTHIRKGREKTKVMGEFKLWESTKRIIRHFSKDKHNVDDLLFLSPRKQLPLTVYTVQDGERAQATATRHDRSYPVWRRLFNKAGCPTVHWKHMRSTAATGIDSACKNITLTSMFLAHTPRTIAETNYLANRHEYQAELDGFVENLDLSLGIRDKVNQFVDHYLPQEDDNADQR